MAGQLWSWHYNARLRSRKHVFPASKLLSHHALLPRAGEGVPLPSIPGFLSKHKEEREP